MANPVMPQPVVIAGDVGWKREDVNTVVAGEIADNNGIDRRGKRAAEKFELAKEVIELAEKEFNRTLTKLVDTEKQLGDTTKRVCGSIRKSADDLRSGLEKVQKTANFGALEKQVAILERAAVALTTLAALEKDGKLERLLAAIK